MAGTTTAGHAWRLSVVQADDPQMLPPTLLANTWSNWMLVCFAQLWLLGVMAMVVRQVGGWRALRRIERAPFVALPPEWQRRFDALRLALGIARPVVVRMAERVSSPFTARMLRPLVWLPLALLTQLPRDQIEVLLAHELAHIRRLDWCWNTVQCVIESVLFHHPGMWWLCRRIREERELACDDLAVAVCGDALVLAEALAGLQHRRLMPDPPRLGLAARGSALRNRIAHLLSAAPARPNWRWPGVLLLLLCSGTLLAMQVVPPSSLLTNLRFDASSEGLLTPGNHRQFTASYLGAAQRRYRIDMDAAGQVHEAYTEDGRSKPIDDSVRAWLKKVSVMNAGGESLQADVPTPPRPEPSGPAPPGPSDSDEFKTLMSGLRADPRLAARIGRPVTLDRESFRGSVHTWGSRDFHLWGVDDPVGGKADFTVTLAGPDGRVDVAWSGKTVAGVWQAETMVITPRAR